MAMEPGEALARQEIRATAERYFFGVDTRDIDMVAGCFAREFRFELRLDPPLVLTTPAGIRELLDVKFPPAASNHAVSNMLIDMTDGGARSTIHAVAYVCIGERVLVRGLRYTDRWVEQYGAWRIADRLHQPRWQFEQPAIAPRGYSPD